MTVNLRIPNPATLVGRGKVAELAALTQTCRADFIVIDDELTPAQNRNIEEAAHVRVLDRSAVILDIFARRAKSHEGKLQVELAQLEYLAPRLVGRGQMLSQQAGRIGTRGPGETALEYDRRRIRERVTLLKSRLHAVRRHRKLHRMRREGVPIPLVSLVGYTNAGKSTLMNTLTRAGVMVEDRLFATLDPTVRRLKLPSGREVLMADTVGFIRRLPHQLVEAFRATFEEIAHATLILHVIDVADPEHEGHMRVVRGVLDELGLGDKPRVNVMNKIDQKGAARGDGDAVALSARTGEGIDVLLHRLDTLLLTDYSRVRLSLPYARGDILAEIRRMGQIVGIEYRDETTLVDCWVHQKHLGRYRPFMAMPSQNGGHRRG